VVKIASSADPNAKLHRQQDLSGEVAILDRLASRPFVPAITRHGEAPDAAWVGLERIEGVQVGEHPLTPAFTFRLAAALLSLSSAGIAHNDLTSDNILVVDSRRPVLVDFDQAIRTSVAKALLANFAGLPRKSVFAGLPQLLAERARARLPKGVRKLVRKIVPRRGPALPRLPVSASPGLRQMHSAWALAARSSASSPGIRQAYYEYAFEGLRFPGERPWAARWDSITSLVDVTGKRVLELGCNIGLLSTSALRAGATSATAVDRDPAILRAAAMVASAHGVAPRFVRLDLDSHPDWESKLGTAEYDTVFALNLLHWVQSKGRLLEYLSQFRTIVVEGHDELGVEAARLESVGLSVVKHAATERGRPLIVAVREAGVR
jgi:predicted Ser/Thr protein kinase